MASGFPKTTSLHFSEMELAREAFEIFRHTLFHGEATSSLGGPVIDCNGIENSHTLARLLDIPHRSATHTFCIWLLVQKTNGMEKCVFQHAYLLQSSCLESGVRGLALFLLLCLLLRLQPLSMRGSSHVGGPRSYFCVNAISIMVHLKIFGAMAALAWATCTLPRRIGTRMSSIPISHWLFPRSLQKTLCRTSWKVNPHRD